MPIDYTKLWRSQDEAYAEALAYIHGRRSGAITSMRTPWDRVNEAGVDGLEWNSLTVIGGRPGTGKTLVKDQIIRLLPLHNPEEEIRTLDFSFEMVNRASKIREFSAELRKPYKYICSAGDEHTLTEEDFEKLKAYAKAANRRTGYPVDIVDSSCTLDTFDKIIEAYMKKHSKQVKRTLTHETTGAKREVLVTKYPNTLMTVDHSYLFKQSKQHKSKTDMLYDLGERLTKNKRRYPIAFVVLSQLGRLAELPERNEDGKYGNYILPSDILGGDALMQHADMCIGINRPAERNIKYYGPERFIIEDDSTLVFHFLKSRTGDTGLAFFKGEYHRMTIIEGGLPGTAGLITNL